MAAPLISDQIWSYVAVCGDTLLRVLMDPNPENTGEQKPQTARGRSVLLRASETVQLTLRKVSGKPPSQNTRPAQDLTGSTAVLPTCLSLIGSSNAKPNTATAYTEKCQPPSRSEVLPRGEKRLETIRSPHWHARNRPLQHSGEQRGAKALSSSPRLASYSSRIGAITPGTRALGGRSCVASKTACSAVASEIERMRGQRSIDYVLEQV